MPAHARIARFATLRAGACGAALALALGGCGAQPPQAPVAQANRVAAALTGIAAACGESYQQRAFHPQASPSAPLQAAAALRAGELADVYAKNPEWIYQGETLRQIVALAVSYLRECGLARVAQTLERQTARA